MTIFDRKKQVVSDSYIFKGVMQGAAEGMEDYLVEAERMQQAVDEMNEAAKQHGWDGEWLSCA